MPAIVPVEGLRKTYASGFEALKGIDLAIEEGEILALLGPNGAGKTTLISAICGITVPTAGRIPVGGHDVVTDYRRSRAAGRPRAAGGHPRAVREGLNTVRFSRGLFGKPRDDAYIERILRQLSLWDKRDTPTRELSGGMKRRVLIAKALAHEPRVLFLDEPTAGVDVELRKSMWEIVDELRAAGTTIILTTHYIEEAEAIADRIAVINDGRILLVEDKAKLMQRMGQKQLTIELQSPVGEVPARLAPYGLVRGEDGLSLTYAYDRSAERTGIVSLLGRPLARPGSRCATCRPSRSRSRTSSSTSCGTRSGGMNWRAIRAIYVYEMSRTFRTLLQSLIAPVISTSLYFVVFGTAIGSRIQEVEGVELRRLHRARAHHADGADAVDLERLVRHLLPEVHRHDLRAPLGADVVPRDRHRLRRRGGDQVVPDRPRHLRHREPLRGAARGAPVAMLAFLALTCLSFSLFGFIVGIWAKNFEQLQLVPLLIVSPLVFLGGAFYSISMLPPVWQKITLFNPVVYLISGFRWSFFGTADVSLGVSLAAIAFFSLVCLAIIWWIFRTGYRVRT